MPPNDAWSKLAGLLQYHAGAALLELRNPTLDSLRRARQHLMRDCEAVEVEMSINPETEFEPLIDAFFERGTKTGDLAAAERKTVRSLMRLGLRQALPDAMYAIRKRFRDRRHEQVAAILPGIRWDVNRVAVKAVAYGYNAIAFSAIQRMIDEFEFYDKE